MKLNPNHPSVQKVDDQWHKLCALAMASMDVDHVVITMDTLEQIASRGLFITIQELDDGLHLRLVTEADAHRLARENGGLPS